MKLTNILAAAALLSASLGSQAAIISVDWKVAGDNRAFIETTSGTEWLNVNETQGLSVNTVSGEFGANGLYEGFRVATASEMQPLFDLFLGSAPNLVSEPNPDYTNILSYTNEGMAIMADIRGVIGETNANVNSAVTVGMYFDDAGTGSSSVRMTHFIESFSSDAGRLIYDRTFSSLDNGYTGSSVGVFLISDGGNTFSTINNPGLLTGGNTSTTEVSEPHALALLAFGFAGLVLRRKA